MWWGILEAWSLKEKGHILHDRFSWMPELKHIYYAYYHVGYGMTWYEEHLTIDDEDYSKDIKYNMYNAWYSLSNAFKHDTVVSPSCVAMWTGERQALFFAQVTCQLPIAIQREWSNNIGDNVSDC